MRNIIITGGGFFNKGAQAMTLITVDQLRRRFPNHRIFLLSPLDKQRPQQEKMQYAFDFMGWYPIKFAHSQSDPLLRAICLLRSRAELLECEQIYKNTDLMLDISGYALGSNWSSAYCKDYLDHLQFAKAFHIPVYIMPQSFGPFDFQGKEGRKLDALCRKLLPSAKLICAREQEGYDALTGKYGLSNVIQTPDLVLNSKEINLANVCRQVPELDLPPLAENSVGIIPNQRTFDVGNPQEIFSFYQTIIDGLLSAGNTVYLLFHADADLSICTALKEMYPDHDRVILLTREFSCVEFNELVKGFRYLVVSRFHAIVHAYKNGIPCIVLGWAAKYRDLMRQFGQLRYIFDARSIPDAGRITQTILQMEENSRHEAVRIHDALIPLQEADIFDFIKL